MDKDIDQGEVNLSVSTGDEAMAETSVQAKFELQSKGSEDDTKSGNDNEEPPLIEGKCLAQETESGADNPGFVGDAEENAVQDAGDIVSVVEDHNEIENGDVVPSVKEHDEAANGGFVPNLEDHEGVHKCHVGEKSLSENKSDEDSREGERDSQNADEDYFSVDSNDNGYPTELEESGTDLKRWNVNLQLNMSTTNDNKYPKKEPMVGGIDKTAKKSKQSPFMSAVFLSKYLTFWWMQSLFATGYKKALEQDDLYDVCPNDTAADLCDRLERQWNKEAYDENGKIREQASLIRAIVRVFGFKYMLLAIPSVLAEGFRLSQPIFLGFITRYFAEGSQETETNAYLYGLGLALCAMGTSLNMTPLNFLRQRIGMRLRISTSALVYKKILRLSNKALSQTTTGHIVNLVSVDAQKLDFAAMFLHYLWLSPVIIIITGYLLWREIGVSCLSGVGLLLLLAPLQMIMGRLLMKFRRAVVKFTDQRVKVMNEVITGMRVLKLYTWEESFTQLVDKLRQQEIREIRKLSFLRAGFMSFFFSSASLVSFVTMMTYVLLGNRLTAQKVFTCVSLFNGSRLVMTLFFPIAVTLMNEGRVSLERMENLLKMDELQAPGLEKSNLRPKSFTSVVAVDGLHASWTENAKTLNDVSFRALQGDLVAVVGPVGCGKSSLLMAVLGELKAEKGTVDVTGRIAYVSQEAWIFNGSLKNNITFGQEYNEKKYQRVIEICALQRDIEMLPQGDKTLVGERGVALSGGQKARLNLARAVYFDADIYILDDPLSAVDAHVGRHLFDQCINGYLSNKLRILVTHQLQYLHDADQILVLSEGSCIAKGTYDHLILSGVDFMSLLHVAEEPDSALETEYEEEEGRSRSFSRQESGLEDTRGNLVSTVARKDSSVVMERKLSISSTRKRKESILSDAVGSDLSIASKSARVKVFEEKALPKEMKFEGSVTVHTYIKFFRAGYGLFVWFLVLMMFIFCQGIYILADWWLSRWTNEEEKSINKTYEHRDRDLVIYAALVIGLVALGLARALLFFFVILRSSRSLHGMMFRATLRSPVRFFDTNSIGRILNRFSKDMGLVDDMFSFVFFDFTQTVLVVLGIVLLVCATNPVVFAWAAPIVIGFFILRRYYIKTAREVKRIEGLNRSPVFGHFSTTLLGLPTIRAFRVQGTFVDFYNRFQDDHTKAWFSFISSAAWLSFRLEILSTLFITFVVFVSIALRDSLGLTAGQVGLMLSYTINVTGVFQQCVRQSTEVENHMTSVERVLEYCELEPEAPPETDVKPPLEWPHRGSIRFKNMSFSYAKGLPNVLDDVTCHIKSTEKIGVCGRTGAGKSSLLTTLFRLSEPTGRIFIDDVDIMQLGLRDLRSKISIIPQDPILFSGTMRKNLDPFGNHSDTELWCTLDEVQLKDAVEALPGMLESEMAESGNNLSVGQRQLVCLARAILKRNKILVIDEATANVDPITDGLIQTKIREKFKDCTVLTIAHRLNTIMDSDRIMVLDAGKIKEFDHPYNLMKSKRNLLYKLVAQTGGSEAQKLFEIARRSHVSKKMKSKERRNEDVDSSRGGQEATKSLNRSEFIVPAIKIVPDSDDDRMQNTPL